MRRPVLTLLLICAFTYGLGLGGPAITDSDEAFYAEASREMVESRDWLTPRFNYEDRWQKPVLYYWLTASTYLVTGPTESAARLWAALSGETTVTAQPVRPSEPGVPARQPAPPEEGAAWATLVVTVRATDGSVPRGTQVGYVRGAEATLLPVDEKGRHTFSHVPPGSVEVFARAPGYREARETRPLVEGLATSVTLQLKPERGD